MAEGVASGGKAAWAAFKAHWGWFLLAFAAIIIAALWYDHKNSGDLTKKVAGLPLVGKLFGVFALFFALGGGAHAPPASSARFAPAAVVIDLAPDASGVFTSRAVLS